ncbi:MAG: type II toxin-antitoxin system HicA family toxin [Candidatus Omnitrophica bacterium]|nr:type II toxin-antitoxin system HicA family toxin [Candidatus Omnitrophota bacterium]
MARLPVVSSSELVKVLEREGFHVVRQRGSHLVLQKRTPRQRSQPSSPITRSGSTQVCTAGQGLPRASPTSSAAGLPDLRRP